MSESKKTVIIGATPNSSRYAYKVAERLTGASIEFVPVGIKSGEVLGQSILQIKERPMIENVHTVTLYIGSQNQLEWYNYILSLNPKRILFNPETENIELKELAEAQGIEVVEGCTMVMLGIDSY